MIVADNTAIETPPSSRRIVFRTRGRGGGPITRLVSPGDAGQLIKPFVFLDYFDFRGGSGDGGVVHPHSGIATHTTLLEGSFVYGDSTGASGVLHAGSVEWMRAGGGVWHGGSLVPGAPLRGFQLWVAMPGALELAPAESRYVLADEVPGDERVRVLLGEHAGVASPIAYREPLTYLHVRLRAGERWTFTPAFDHDVAWLAVATGELRVDGTTLHRELALFEPGSAPIDVLAESDAEFVVGSARKHPHTLVTGSYSVHTSAETLRQGEAGIATVAKSMRLIPWVPLEASRVAR